MDLEQLKYPVGNFKFPTEFDDHQINNWIEDIAALPVKLKTEVSDISDEKLSWNYRPEGWNIRQVVHHFADSHMNAFIRFKLTLTEDSPEVKPYFEDLWAKMPDSTNTPIKWSLDIINGLHNRWIETLKNLKPEDLLRTYYHTEYQRTFELRQVIALYAWHCRHHLAHIKQAKEARGKYN